MLQSLYEYSPSISWPFTKCIPVTPRIFVNLLAFDDDHCVGFSILISIFYIFEQDDAYNRHKLLFARQQNYLYLTVHSISRLTILQVGARVNYLFNAALTGLLWFMTAQSGTCFLNFKWTYWNITLYGEWIKIR